MGFERVPLQSKLTKETCKIICQEITRGVPYKYACKIAGVNDTTVLKWRKLGEQSDDDEDPYRIFYLNFERAKANAVAYRVDGIRKAGDGGNWQSHAWWLERMAHEDFGRKSTIDANVNANVKQINLADLFDAKELENILKESEDEDLE